MAFLWASSCSLAAMISTVGPIWRTPSGVSSWKVTLRMKLSVETPL